MFQCEGGLAGILIGLLEMGGRIIVEVVGTFERSIKVGLCSVEE